jgi:nitroimidazol reductase NimA-like FMN-containing flavoprotein (pyridoxamine 5'-phosphate oxidase superfamily)
VESDSAPISDLTKLRREPSLADPRWSTIKRILTDSYVCHLAFVDDAGQPFAVPTIHALVGDHLYVHGSAASRTLRAIGGGARVCVTVTLTDGFVLARSVLNHNINFRSVMVFGNAEFVDTAGEKEAALHAYFETVFPGRWEEAREPTVNEYARAAILRLPLEQASAKISSGPPKDEDYDYELDVWAGVVPIESKLGETEPDPALRDGIDVPASIAKLRERWG